MAAKTTTDFQGKLRRRPHDFVGESVWLVLSEVERFVRTATDRNLMGKVRRKARQLLCDSRTIPVPGIKKTNI